MELSGDTLLVGARYHIHDEFEQGAAYIFRHDGTQWIEEAELLASDAGEGDWFGWGLGIDGDTAIVGAFLDDDLGEDSGSAYVFEFDGSNWVETQKLFASDGAALDFFGRNVEVDGDLAVICAWTADVGMEANAGKAYVFRHDGTSWVEEDILVASDASAGSALGGWASIEGDTIVVGAPYDGSLETSSGAVYIFEFNGTEWIETQKLQSPDGEQQNAVFGNWVETSGSRLVVGSVYRDDFAGAAYVYEHDGSNWAFTQKLTASDRESRDFFGYVTIEDDIIVVGARGDDDINSASGAGYIFELVDGVWTETHKLKGFDNSEGDAFGWGLSLDGGVLAITAKNDDDNGTDAGAVYLFDLGCSSDCVADVNGDGMLSPTDFTAWIAAFNSGAPECDQNQDGNCSPTDFTAWIANFNLGC
ncbi:MAG: hypothetical protein Phyf2KO_07490 [Phycisphaerales bacterium]